MKVLLRGVVFFILIYLPCKLNGNNLPVDTLDLNRKIEQSRALIEQDELDSAKALLKDLLKPDTIIRVSRQWTQVYDMLAGIYRSQSMLDEAINYTEKAWYSGRKTDRARYGKTYLPDLAYIYWEKGNFSQALKYAHNARRFFKVNPDSSKQMSLHNIFGLIYRDLGSYPRSEEHFKESIAMAERYERKGFKGVVLSNLGSLYMRMNEHKRAIDYYEQGRKIELEFENYQATGRSLSVLGELYLETGKLEEADNSLQKALHYNNIANDLIGMCRTRNGQGKLHLMKGNYSQAKHYYSLAEEMARKKGARKELMKSCEGLYKTFSMTGNYEKAFEYQGKYLEMYKESYNIDEIVHMQHLQYRLSMNQQRYFNQQEQIRKQNTINRLLLALAILSALLTTLFIYLFIRIRKSKKSLQQKTTEIQQQKDKLEKLNENLTLAKRKAEESEQLKDQFLRNISHEIRTPLNGILGFSSIIAEGNLDKQQRMEYYGFIRKNANLLLSTIDDILDIARIRTKQVEVFNEAFPVRNMLAELKEMFAFDKNYSKKENVDILMDLDTVSPDEILYSDPSKIQKILIILTDNALKFTREGYVRIGCQPNGQDVTFYVKDTGIGISKEHQGLIYESFRQAETELNRQFEGLGAGLSIAKSFAELLRGKLWFESKQEQGTTFYFTLPHTKEA